MQVLAAESHTKGDITGSDIKSIKLIRLVSQTDNMIVLTVKFQKYIGKNSR